MDALADLKARVAAAPSDPDLRLRLASAFLRQGLLDEAEAELDAALALATTGSRTRLTTVVLRQRVRNLIVQRELWREDSHG